MYDIHSFLTTTLHRGQYVLWSSGQLQGPDGEKRKYCDPWKKNDLIGCGYDTVMQQIFFTQNGLYLGM